eukprot:CAMPEP_0184481176 /NCGR_PEP_ID=MMETSP0113_2-20130426/2704_1 /TAXON_ID=91329 /ORGANISM="Norrisiella sphaerica, Strain BC52" /LENGTH=194 /DNA_ID=CAMNT_0026860115 /DNA_START=36 /DNA_END=620 /DNA_ORIENTATION=-
MAYAGISGNLARTQNRYMRSFGDHLTGKIREREQPVAFRPISGVMRRSRELVPVMIKREKKPGRFNRPRKRNGDGEYQNLLAAYPEPLNLRKFRPHIFVWEIVKMLVGFSRIYIKWTFYWAAILSLWMTWSFFFDTYKPLHWGGDTHWMHEVKRHLFGDGNFPIKGTAGADALGGVFWSARDWKHLFPHQWVPG